MDSTLRNGREKYGMSQLKLSLPLNMSAFMMVTIDLADDILISSPASEAVETVRSVE